MIAIQTTILQQIDELLTLLQHLDIDQQVELINTIRQKIHRCSPFINEPVDCIQWIKIEQIEANDYNPNVVAPPPEMELLKLSIDSDGYTQPIVAWDNDGLYEVVDGFHRNQIGRENEKIRERIRGYLPLAIINVDRLDRGDRIASTIRHNRARGKHAIQGMSNIVMELKRRNWSDKKIGKELGMDPDEVLRLCQITGLAEMFADKEFSQAWEAEESNTINEIDTLDINDERDETDIPPIL